MVPTRAHLSSSTNRNCQRVPPATGHHCYTGKCNSQRKESAIGGPMSKLTERPTQIGPGVQQRHQ